MTRWTSSWAFAWIAALVVHVAVLPVPILVRPDASEREYVSFELAEPPPEPPAPLPAVEPEEPLPAPPGPKSPDPTADPNRTSERSNRPPDPTAAPDDPVPLVTGAPLEASQLVPEGVGMGVRVGNTWAEGYDADVAPGAIAGFEGGGAGGGDGMSSTGVGRRDRPPELLRAYQPPYPEDMRAAGVSGRVLLEVLVGVTGRAEAVHVISGIHPTLDADAVAAIARFRWAPARRQGQKVATTVRIAIKYTLD